MASYSSIADYALIGDCHTVALVSKDGSIDWYCPGRFDAPPVFWRILDAGKGGFFSVRPSCDYRSRRRYRGDTNLLETTFDAGHSIVHLTDFMPIFRRRSSRLGHDVGTSRKILRLVEVEGHACDLDISFKPAFEFGRAVTSLQVIRDKGAIAQSGHHFLTLYCPKAEFDQVNGNEVRGVLKPHPGEHAWFTLTICSSAAEAESALKSDVSVHDRERTEDYWEEWSSYCRYQGRYRDMVLRSALTLKLLTYEPTGAVVAAPTTSLPELIGAIRNWDYRYTWLRDGSLMLYALSTLGYHEEATDFISWLAKTIGDNEDSRPQI
ncbi:MAG: glycoside hydrolase family 15 protein, partial [Chloroflexi bacterium]|nr:glycoside hydrolase family 15 protein [Chloroflexota bacterium]